MTKLDRYFCNVVFLMAEIFPVSGQNDEHYHHYHHRHYFHPPVEKHYYHPPHKALLSNIQEFCERNMPYIKSSRSFMPQYITNNLVTNPELSEQSDRPSHKIIKYVSFDPPKQYNKKKIMLDEEDRTFPAHVGVLGKRVQLAVMPLYYKIGIVGIMILILILLALKGLAIQMVIFVFGLASFLAKLQVKYNWNGTNQPISPVTAHPLKAEVQTESQKNIHVHIHPDKHQLNGFDDPYYGQYDLNHFPEKNPFSEYLENQIIDSNYNYDQDTFNMFDRQDTNVYNPYLTNNLNVYNPSVLQKLNALNAYNPSLLHNLKNAHNPSINLNSYNPAQGGNQNIQSSFLSTQNPLSLIGNKLANGLETLTKFYQNNPNINYD